MYGWHGWDWTPGGGLLMGLGMLLIWAVPIGLIAALVVYLINQSGTAKRPESAIEILEKAYARGDVSRDEFLQKKADLLGNMKFSLKQNDTP
jgi:putative membrane protein